MPEQQPPTEELEAKDIKEYPATVYLPPRQRQRQRFPENCVYLKDSDQAARRDADPERHLHAARVCGPSRSSEGFRLYYLVRWLG